MRLSDIKGERAFEVIADVIDPAFNIASDKTAARLFKRGDKPDGVDATEWAMTKARECVPQLMREHRDDIVTILAAIEGVDMDEYMASVTIPSIIKSVFEMLTDEDLLAFLS